MTDTNPTSPTPWSEVQGRHLWHIRAYWDPGPVRREWFYQAHTRGRRHAGIESHPEDVRWPTPEEALKDAANYIRDWEDNRPDF